MTKPCCAAIRRSGGFPWSICAAGAWPRSTASTALPITRRAASWSKRAPNWTRRCSPTSRSRSSRCSEPRGGPLRRFGHHRVGIVQQRRDRRQQLEIAAIARRDQAVADEPAPPDPLDRRSGEFHPERSIVQQQQLIEPRCDQLLAGKEGLVGGCGIGELVPRTNRQTIVA